MTASAAAARRDSSRAIEGAPAGAESDLFYLRLLPGLAILFCRFLGEKCALKLERCIQVLH